MRSHLTSGLAVVLAATCTAWAQLTPKDIEALRLQGQQEGWTFTVGENSATSRSLKELTGLVVPPDWQVGASFDLCNPRGDLPPSFDWRNYNGYNFCTPIKDQRSCGSCWAFALVGAVESNILIKDGVISDIAEQWLVSCCNLGGCSGEWPGKAANYLLCGGPWQDPWGDSGAIPEYEFVYTATDAPCESGPYTHPWCLKTWAFVGPEWGIPTVEQLKQAILDYGPLCVCVYADAAFQAYNGGVFNACKDHWINHAVVLVGWDDNQAGGVWFMRNSWGPGWGEQGYMRIKYDCSRIGYNALHVDYAARDGLRVLPSERFMARGPVGGPFEPAAGHYLIEYWGDQPADYTVTVDPPVPWLALSGGTSGTLAVGQTAEVHVAPTVHAKALPAGAHVATLRFTDTTAHLGDTTRDVILAVGNGSAQYAWPLDTDPGWTTEGEWAFGPPLGQGGEFGWPDPTAGYTGANVYGYNLAGDYANKLGERYLTTPPLDCTGLYDIRLGFWRWLGVETPQCDRAAVRVSNNGISWRRTWRNDEEVADSAWSPVELDISDVADNQPAVQLRWVMGPTDYSVRYCGWNIDDIRLTGLEQVPAYSVGDMNCDGLVNQGDIDGFVLALSDPGGYAVAFPNCYLANADCNIDGVIDFADIGALLAVMQP